MADKTVQALVVAGGGKGGYFYAGGGGGGGVIYETDKSVEKKSIHYNCWSD